MAVPERLAAIVAAAVVALAAAGCGGADEVTPPAFADQPAIETTAGADPVASATPVRAVDPCALVSKVDAERLAGTPLREPVPGAESCTYTGPASGPTAQVEVYVGDGAKKILDIDRELGHDLRPIAGVGDEAHIEDGAVFVSSDGVWIAIRLVSLADPAVYRKALEDLVRAVVTRL
ncbi:hypothetical protein [Phytohabitans rumicis]|uniref:DUF3558 domain-containing protein n=1 Tax=Phytohabitans rumicis TaxID=1076125 RepID=A0A6V8KVN7_9ACTN|nr:hypothetical protein [Phytohabitans rumicis]GFJ87904.1 hypothetical protein Prum_015460 [Phytohabitans rumicis]